MHHAAGSYLIRYKYGDRSLAAPKYTEGGNKAAVIVETRPSYWLPLVLRNFAEKMPDWNFYLVAPQHVITFIHQQIKGHWNFVSIKFDGDDVIGDRLSRQNYNKLMLGVHKADGSKSIWRHIKEEHILVFQSDCICFRSPSEDHLKWDYIGAVCGPDRNLDTFVMNGGFSLRRRKAMMKACAELAEQIVPITGEDNEDVIFTDHLRSNGYTIPPSRRLS